jgi:hypothetical protein
MVTSLTNVQMVTVHAPRRAQIRQSALPMRAIVGID